MTVMETMTGKICYKDRVEWRWQRERTRGGCWVDEDLKTHKLLSYEVVSARLLPNKRLQAVAMVTMWGPCVCMRL